MMSNQALSTTYGVVGMTCGHCVEAVTAEVRAIAGVTDVSIELRPGATSQVTVLSTSPLGDAAVAAALDEAGGYRLVS